jgi:hypothetical protein
MSGDREVSRRRGASFDRVKPACFGGGPAPGRLPSDGSTLASSTGMPRYSPARSGLLLQPRREADRPRRIPGQGLDAGTAEHGELALLDRGGERLGDDAFEHVLPDLLGKALLHDRLRSVPLAKSGQRGLLRIGARDAAARLFRLLRRDLDLENRQGRRLFLSLQNRHERSLPDLYALSPASDPGTRTSSLSRGAPLWWPPETSE